MSELKTKPNTASVEEFLNTIKDKEKRNDCHVLAKLMKKVVKFDAAMWGKNIVGFGNYHYTYASGREGDWFVCGFSPRKAAISIYFSLCDISQMSDLLEKLGKHKIGKSCLYVKTLADIDIKILEKMLQQAVTQIK